MTRTISRTVNTTGMDRKQITATLVFLGAEADYAAAMRRMRAIALRATEQLNAVTEYTAGARRRYDAAWTAYREAMDR